jgi:excisionase family DNA binding protein
MKLSVPAEARALRRPNGSVAEWRSRGSVEVLTVHEVAAYLKLPISTVYRLACRGDLPCQKVGRQWRFHKAALDEWFRGAAARETPPEDDGGRPS